VYVHISNYVRLKVFAANHIKKALSIVTGVLTATKLLDNSNFFGQRNSMLFTHHGCNRGLP
jgi:hypothetical protein